MASTTERSASVEAGAGTIVPAVRKIAVLRANSLGDLMFALPALEALRTTYPQAEIVLLAQTWHRQFFDQRPGPVHRVIPIPVWKGVRDEEPGNPEDPDEQDRFFGEMGTERFDIALQAHGGGRNSNPFLLRLGARLTVGHRTPDAAVLDRWIPYVYYQSEVLRYLELVSLVGASTAEIEPRLQVTEDDRREAINLVPRDRPIVVMHPGASDPRRQWPAAKFAAVGDALVRQGPRVVVTGVQAERGLVDSVVEEMSEPAIGLCGVLTLSGLAGLLSLASLVISNDTGPLHLARAVGAPTVGIYWGVNLITAGPITTARHRPVVSWRLDCPDCGFDYMTGRHHHLSSLVTEISVEEVLEPAFELLAEGRGAGAGIATGDA